MDIHFLEQLGLSERDSLVYMALLRLGSQSVRRLAEYCDINRGSVYESLKRLQDIGLVTYCHKEKKQYFLAENPSKLKIILEQQEDNLKILKKQIEAKMPELHALFKKEGERPVARYYEKNAIKFILEDVLDTSEASEEKLYRIYSSFKIREVLYDDFPTFSDVRIAKGIRVKAIAIGQGGELRGLDERKWLQENYFDMPTYIFIYPRKTAYISLNTAHDAVGVCIENVGIYQTQKLIFDELWKKL